MAEPSHGGRVRCSAARTEVFLEGIPQEFLQGIFKCSFKGWCKDSFKGSFQGLKVPSSVAL